MKPVLYKSSAGLWLGTLMVFAFTAMMAFADAYAGYSFINRLFTQSKYASLVMTGVIACLMNMLAIPFTDAMARIKYKLSNSAWTVMIFTVVSWLLVYGAFVYLHYANAELYLPKHITAASLVNQASGTAGAAVNTVAAPTAADWRTAWSINILYMLEPLATTLAAAAFSWMFRNPISVEIVKEYRNLQEDRKRRAELRSALMGMSVEPEHMVVPLLKLDQDAYDRAVRAIMNIKQKLQVIAKEELARSAGNADALSFLNTHS